ncbi:MAG: histidine kinase [Flavobacteriales bacterium]|nr:histidine kinase [Flavobacteriales bacterium]
MNKNIVLHLLGSIAFLSIPLISFTYLEMERGFFNVPHYQRSQLSYLLLLVFFYANYFFYIPKLYFPKRYFLLLLAIVGSYFVIKYLPRYFIDIDYCDSHHIDGRVKCVPQKAIYFNKELRFFILFLFVMILSFVLRVNNQLAKIKSEKLKAEVSYLKAQINPHFLFNTLNSIYALTLEKSDEAPEAVLKLSSMMRYVVTESIADVVPIAKELTYIKDYIALQRLRLDESTTVNFTIEGDHQGKNIAPLILISFIENAFKYGANPDRESEISIAIILHEKGLDMNVKNEIVAEITTKEGKTEKGVKNSITRLNYMYPNQHKLNIIQTDTDYEINLSIEIA